MDKKKLSSPEDAKRLLQSARQLMILCYLEEQYDKVEEILHKMPSHPEAQAILDHIRSRLNRRS